MSDFYMLNSNLPVNQKIIQLNTMILELAGMVSSGQFNKNELDSLYANLPVSRQFLRNQGIGNTLSTYTNWSDISDQQGYSIWKYGPTDYSHNTNNNVYFDGQLFTLRGQAGTEQATAFDNVYLYEADSHPGYVTELNAGNTNLNSSFYIMASNLDYLYMGSSSQFAGFNINWKVRGAGYTLVVQYWTGTAWITLGSANNLLDDTNSFMSTGVMTWTIPSNWNTTTVNGISKYWIRISTTTNPTIVGQAYYIIPTSSVVALLALSSTDITNDNWCWCSYNGNIYVTLPNTGGFGGEGSTFIKGTSTSQNLQNFFIYNNPITADYQSTTYSQIKWISTTYNANLNDGILFCTVNSNYEVTLPNAFGNAGAQIIIKKIAGGSTLTIGCVSGETIDGSATLSVSTLNTCYTLVSDGTNWRIIGKV